MFVRYFLLLTIAIAVCYAEIEAPCRWYGYAPFCFIGNSCPEGCAQVKGDKRGDGALCWISQKNYCCCMKKTFDSIVNTIADSGKK